MKVKEYLKYVKYGWTMEIANHEDRKEKFQDNIKPSEVEPRFLNSECKIIYLDKVNQKVVIGVKKPRATA